MAAVLRGRQTDDGDDNLSTPEPLSQILIWSSRRHSRASAERKGHEVAKVSSSKGTVVRVVAEREGLERRAKELGERAGFENTKT